MAKKEITTSGVKEITEITSTKQYEVEDLGDVKPKVKLGGSDITKYVPNINASFYDDEFFLNFNRKDKIVTDEPAKLSNGKVSQTVNNNTDEYYLDADGNFKWDIVWNSKPDKLKLEWDIEHTGGIRFVYQGELTPEEIAEGCLRPENVVGSYAVYCNKANNKYKTGKLCHIYRPFVIDANEKKEWCKLEIKNKKLTIDLPEDFMDSAVYPVRLDPTFGYTTPGLTYATLDGTAKPNGSIYNTYTASAGDTITKFSVYCRYEYTAEVAAYTIVTSDLVTRLGTATSITGGASAGWVDSSAISEAMAAGTVYGCAFGTPSGVMRFYYDSDTGYAKRHNSAGALPSSWTTDATLDRIYSIYATYTAGAVGSDISTIVNYYRQQGIM